MRTYILLLFLLFLWNCSSSKEKTRSSSRFEIVNTPVILDNDTININELRFYKIQSARDAMKLMYLNYGEWDRKIPSKHQENINRIVWKNVNLIDANDKAYTVIADGTETLKDYFACLIVYDSEGRNCFDDNHPDKEVLTNLFVKKMNGLDRSSSYYRLFQ